MCVYQEGGYKGSWGELDIQGWEPAISFKKVTHCLCLSSCMCELHHLFSCKPRNHTVCVCASSKLHHLSPNDTKVTAGPRCGVNPRPGIPYSTLIHFNSLFNYKQCHKIDILVNKRVMVEVKGYGWEVSQEIAKLSTPYEWSHSLPRAAMATTKLTR